MSEYQDRVTAVAKLIAQIPAGIAAVSAGDWSGEPLEVAPTGVDYYTAQRVIAELDEFEYSVQMTNPIVSGQWLKFGTFTDDYLEASKRFEEAKSGATGGTMFRIVKRRKAGAIMGMEE